MTTRDVHAIDGKLPAPDAHFDVVVVGAGSAGTAAAIAAAAGGASVLLVDENPVPGGLMGTDVPLFYGGRMTAAVQQPGRMLEQIFATNPALEAAFEAGVDVRLGTVAWGLYVNGPAMRAMPEPMLGIADAESASMIGFDRLVLATGARDLVLGFAGWNQPGVIGAQGFAALLTRYDALASRRVLIVGSDRLGLDTALLALSHGIEVAGIIEIADTVQGPDDLAERLSATGVPIHLGHTIVSTAGGIDGVETARIAPAGGGAIVDIACDTICLAIGTRPATELLDAAGAEASDRIALVGDCATTSPPAPERIEAWSRALGRHAPADTIVCQCEEVTRADLIGVQPPSYLDRPERMAARSLSSLLNDGPAHPDQIKRLTRAGMGQCQGRRCRDQVACLLAQEQGVPLASVPVASFRAPVRPVSLGILADWQEGPEMTKGWDVWFGIPTQWTPYAVIGTPEEADHVAGLGGNMHV
ncbi:MAG: NAD(P)/FAD-dependent oxidoreductase [Candidatus Sphingomonas phytovorans]|nr:NAD(P)/FAD-dependent oxidoreductase [Sphingomonas sp.]WEK00907.1 MAG: NAD(P)/FAD-dependent oxidoreductase [Sphingomonas sp.]